METKNNWKAWLYLAPALVLMAIFTFYPLFNTFTIAFLENYDYLSGESVIESILKEDGGLTLRNFGYVLGITPKEVKVAKCAADALNCVCRDDGCFRQFFYTNVIEYAIPNTIIVTFVTVPLSVIISLLIAVGLNSIKKLNKIFQTIFFIPYVTNGIAIGMVFAVIFAGSNGLWNAIFGLGDKYWIDMGADRTSALIALCIYIIWHALPYKILIFLSGLQGIDKQYYQAAKIDCATKTKTFMRITVPLLSPQILYITITSLIGSFKEYSSIVGLFGKQGTSQGSYNMYTVVYFVYDYIATQPQLAAAAAVTLFAIIMVFTVIQNWVSSKKVHY